jgi:hypothetical protein
MPIMPCKYWISSALDCAFDASANTTQIENRMIFFMIVIVIIFELIDPGWLLGLKFSVCKYK